MLYSLFTPPDRVKFAEYVPHLLVRASSQSKARTIAANRYPSHPLALADPAWVRCAPLGVLFKMVHSAVSVDSPLYFEAYFLTSPEVSQGDIRVRIASLPWPKERDAIAAAILSADATSVTSIKQAGRAEVIARCENMTPALLSHPSEHPLFIWRRVSDAWPNPTKDPNAIPSSFMQPAVSERNLLTDFEGSEAELIRRLTAEQPT